MNYAGIETFVRQHRAVTAAGLVVADFGSDVVCDCEYEDMDVDATKAYLVAQLLELSDEARRVARLVEMTDD